MIAPIVLTLISQVATNCTIRNNDINAQGDNALGIILRNNNDTVVSGNTVYLRNGSWVGVGIEHYDSSVLPMSNLPQTIGNRVSDNTVSSDGTVGTAESTSYGYYAFAASGFDTGAFYNTFENNQATNLILGFIDAGAFGIGSKCTVFRENIANGNFINFLVDETAPVNSLMVDNIDHCSSAPAASAKKQLGLLKHKIVV